MSNRKRKETLARIKAGEIVQSDEGKQWVKECEEKGMLQALRSRLQFHGSLEVSEIEKQTLLSPQTIIKHLRILVLLGEAEELTNLRFVLSRKNENEN